MKKIFFALMILVLSSTMAFSQTRSGAAPYNHGVGVTLGFIDGFTYKTFPTNNFAIQVDLGYRFHYWDGVNTIVSINPNFMYEGAIKNGFYWFLGGGLNIGGAFYHHYSTFVFGINAIGGAEYQFPKIPLALQVDARPGLFIFANRYDTYPRFDYSFLNLTARYTF